MRTAILAALVLILSGCASAWRDIGPSEADGSNDHGTSTAGLTYQLAGDTNQLYAVSLNAGIWTRLGRKPWSQLRNSSPLTTSLAVDPLDPTHLVSGDRNGNASDSDPSLFDMDLVGLHESHDSGATWQFTYSPLSRQTAPTAPPTCATIPSAAIAAIMFSPKGTLFIGTPCGIGRRASGGSSFDFASSPADAGVVTAFAVSRLDTRREHLWALVRRLSNSHYAIVHSSDDGVTWDRLREIPSFLPGPNIGVSQDSPGDHFSLAAFGATAITVFKPLPERQNHSEVLYYSFLQDQFFAQELDNANNGTGGGGRRSVKAFPQSPPFSPGNGTRIFLNAGDDVLEATGVDPTGRLQWSAVANAPSDPVHMDFWDVLPDGNAGFWLATDGGVYKKDSGFGSFNDGLATHHIHTLSVMFGRSGRSTDTLASLAYATSDNDAWFRGGLDPWATYGKLGDANWTAADRRNANIALLVRHATNAELTDFNNGSPPGSQDVGGKLFALGCHRVLDDKGNPVCAMVSQEEWRVIQTRPGESLSHPLLDVVRLAPLPLQFGNGTSITDLSSGSLLTSLSKASSNPVLIRNPSYAAGPDIDDSKYDGWSLEEGGLPPGTSRFWAVGGHGPDAPIYYVCVCSPPAGSPVRIFKQTQRGAQWLEVIPTIFENGKAKNLDILAPGGGTLGGPLFVDQFHGRLALATSEGIAFFDPNSTWSLDPVLTALLTDSRRDPLQPAFSGGNGRDVVLATRALPLLFVSDVAFYEDMQLAVSSPYSGVFYRKQPTGSWQKAELGPLNTPVSAIVPVGSNVVDLFIASEGRGLRETMSLDQARLASYFQIVRSIRTFGSPAVRLMRSDGALMGGRNVRMLILHADGSGLATLLTSAVDGSLDVAAQAQHGDRVFLDYDGDSATTPASTALRE